MLRAALRSSRQLSGLARRSASSTADYACAPYRLIIDATPEQRAAWAEKDSTLHAAMRKHVPAALEHNGEEAFDDHLVGVQSVLRAWGAADHLTNAALFHSIYGTQGFQGFKLPLSHRAEIAELIGPRAERLAWAFCMVDRCSVDATVLCPPIDPAAEPPSFFARAELGGFEIRMRDEQEWLDFLTLSLADWLEQVEGAASRANEAVGWEVGTAWAYRRDGYAGMAALLGAHGVVAAPIMYNAVFAREPEATRHLVQPAVGPMSEAAREAREALDSATLDFFSPGGATALPSRDWRPRPRGS